MLKKTIEEGKLRVSSRTLTAGTCLYRAGLPAETFYLILQGTVKLSMPNYSQDTTIGQGYLVGLQDLMEERYSHTAVLDEDATVLEITKQDLLRAISTITPLRLYLLRQMSKQPGPTALAYE